MVANLYAAVRGLRTPASREALVERLFAERRAYWRLGSAIGEVWSPELHARVHGAARRAPRCARRRCVRVRAARVRQEGRAARRSRAARARVAGRYRGRAWLPALRARRRDRGGARGARLRARAARARERGVDRGAAARARCVRARARVARTRSRPRTARRALAAALSGEAAAERTALQVAAAAARAKGKPNLKIKDAALGQLANAQVAYAPAPRREDRRDLVSRSRGRRSATSMATTSRPAPFTARAVGFDGAAAELAGAIAIAERALWWDPPRRGVPRCGAVRPARPACRGASTTARSSATCSALPTHARAAAAFAQLRANPAPGFTESEAYYVPGMGAIVRTYYVREGGGEPQRRRRSRSSTAMPRRAAGDLGSEAAAIAEHTRREVAWLAEWRRDVVPRVDRQPQAPHRPHGPRVDRASACATTAALGRVARRGARRDRALPRRPSRSRCRSRPSSHRRRRRPTSRRSPRRARSRCRPRSTTCGARSVGRAGSSASAACACSSPLEVLARRPVARAAAEAYMAKLSPAAAEQAAPLLRSSTCSSRRSMAGR